MNKNLVIVVDSDAIIAQTNPEDIHHAQVTKTSKQLISKEAKFIYPCTTIAEAATHMQRVLNSTATAYGTVSLMVQPEAKVAEVSQKTLAAALKYFSPTTSKQNTIFDCIVAAIAEEEKADAIFSFDKFYKTQGFKLASEIK